MSSTAPTSESETTSDPTRPATTPVSSTRQSVSFGNGAIMNGATFNGATMNGGTFNGATFNGATMNGATMNGATFNGGSVNGATFNGASVNGASVNGATFNGATFNGATFNGVAFNGATFNGATIRDIAFAGSLFTGGTLSGTVSGGTMNGRAYTVSAGNYKLPMPGLFNTKLRAANLYTRFAITSSGKVLTSADVMPTGSPDKVAAFALHVWLTSGARMYHPVSNHPADTVTVNELLLGTSSTARSRPISSCASSTSMTTIASTRSMARWVSRTIGPTTRSTAISKSSCCPALRRASTAARKTSTSTCVASSRRPRTAPPTPAARSPKSAAATARVRSWGAVRPLMPGTGCDYVPEGASWWNRNSVFSTTNGGRPNVANCAGHVNGGGLAVGRFCDWRTGTDTGLCASFNTGGLDRAGADPMSCSDPVTFGDLNCVSNNLTLNRYGTTSSCTTAGNGCYPGQYYKQCTDKYSGTATTVKNVISAFVHARNSMVHLQANAANGESRNIYRVSSRDSYEDKLAWWEVTNEKTADKAGNEIDPPIVNGERTLFFTENRPSFVAGQVPLVTCNGAPWYANNQIIRHGRKVLGTVGECSASTLVITPGETIPDPTPKWINAKGNGFVWLPKSTTANACQAVDINVCTSGWQCGTFVTGTSTLVSGAAAPECAPTDTRPLVHLYYPSKASDMYTINMRVEKYKRAAGWKSGCEYLTHTGRCGRLPIENNPDVPGVIGFAWAANDASASLTSCSTGTVMKPPVTPPGSRAPAPPQTPPWYDDVMGSLRCGTNASYKVASETCSCDYGTVDCGNGNCAASACACDDSCGGTGSGSGSGSSGGTGSGTGSGSGYSGSGSGTR